MRVEIHMIEIERVFIQDLEDAGKTGCDVAGRAPALCHGGAPGLDAGLAPFAEGVENGTAGRGEGFAHYAVALEGFGGRVVVAFRTETRSVCTWDWLEDGKWLWWRLGRLTCSIDEICAIVGDAGVAVVCPVAWDVAVVVFEVVDAPFCPRCGVDCFHPEGGRIAGACLGSLVCRSELK